MCIVLGNMDSAAMRPMRQGNPDRVNYDTPYPVAKGVRDSFAHNVVRAIDVGVEASPIARAIQPALEAPPTEDRGRMGGIVDRERISVEEAGLTGVALLGNLHLNAHQFGLVAQYLDEARMWHKHDVLVGPLPQPNRLFP